MSRVIDRVVITGGLGTAATAQEAIDREVERMRKRRERAAKSRRMERTMGLHLDDYADDADGPPVEITEPHKVIVDALELTLKGSRYLHADRFRLFLRAGKKALEEYFAMTDVQRQLTETDIRVLKASINAVYQCAIALVIEPLLKIFLDVARQSQLYFRTEMVWRLSAVLGDCFAGE